MNIDLSSEFGKRVARRLREEQVIWLTTVAPDGSPQPRPVWFLWDGERLLIYSQKNAYKVTHIVRNPAVALNFNSDAEGGDVVVMPGQAEIAPSYPHGDQVPAYLEKYATGIASLGSTPEQFAEEYSVAILVTPTRLRGF